MISRKKSFSMPQVLAIILVAGLIGLFVFFSRASTCDPTGDLVDSGGLVDLNCDSEPNDGTENQNGDPDTSQTDNNNSGQTNDSTTTNDSPAAQNGDKPSSSSNQEKPSTGSEDPVTATDETPSNDNSSTDEGTSVSLDTEDKEAVQVAEQNRGGTLALVLGAIVFAGLYMITVHPQVVNRWRRQLLQQITPVKKKTKPATRKRRR